MNSNHKIVKGIDTRQSLLARQQRSHVLFVLSNAVPGQSGQFLDWYKSDSLQNTLSFNHVISAQHFERHEVDITMGHYPAPEYQYLGIYELSLDGAEEAQPVIDAIEAYYEQEASAEVPAAWLYYPISEKIGCANTGSDDSLIILAFASGISGHEAEFREWYSTRHIRHALYIPLILSAQCFERTNFQQGESSKSRYNVIAVYEQTGTPDEFVDYCKSLPTNVAEKLQFPTMDATCFGESSYRPITQKVVSDM